MASICYSSLATVKERDQSVFQNHHQVIGWFSTNRTVSTEKKGGEYLW